MQPSSAEGLPVGLPGTSVMTWKQMCDGIALDICLLKLFLIELKLEVHSSDTWNSSSLINFLSYNNL